MEPYAVYAEVEPMVEGRNRLTTFFRLILAIPHAFLVGGGMFSGGFSYNSSTDTDPVRLIINLCTAGVLNLALFVTSVFSWFAILITGQQPRGLWSFALFVVSWQVRVQAYIYLFRDEYPPFGEGPYPVVFDVAYPEEGRDRVSVGLRFLYVFPHFIVLFFLSIAWLVTTIIAWFAILFTGQYPAGLAAFGAGVWRWSSRVSAYTWLLTDQYPPFSLEPTPAPEGLPV